MSDYFCHYDLLLCHTFQLFLSKEQIFLPIEVLLKRPRVELLLHPEHLFGLVGLVRLKLLPVLIESLDLLIEQSLAQLGRLLDAKAGIRDESLQFLCVV